MHTDGLHRLTPMFKRDAAIQYRTLEGNNKMYKH